MSEEMKIIMSRLDELDNIKEKLGEIEVRMDTRFDNLEGRFNNLEGRFNNLEGRFDNLEGRFDELEKLNHEEHNMIIEYVDERMRELEDKLTGKKRIFVLQSEGV